MASNNHIINKLWSQSSNFPYPGKNTAILFLQHCMRSLKQKGKCAIIFPERVLFTVNDSAYLKTKKDLVENYNLHKIIKLPSGAFAPYTTITNKYYLL